MNYDFDIEKSLSLDDYATEERKKRRKGSGGSQEFFTGYKLVKQMCDKISEEKWNDKEADFLEPCFGSGQFVVYIVYNKIMHGSTWREALNHTWGVELIELNVIEAHNRVIQLLTDMGIDFDVEEARGILKRNLVCHNFFDWDFQNWCPISENKIKPLF